MDWHNQGQEGQNGFFFSLWNRHGLAAGPKREMEAIKDKTAAVAAVWLWGPSLDVYAQGPRLSSQSFAKAQRESSCVAEGPCY